jgi:hypothetical protein
MLFYPIPGDRPGETQSRMLWIMNAHMGFSGFIASRVIDRFIPASLVEYVQNLRRHVSSRTSLSTL